jgi:ribosomal protein L37AE/L43A
MAASEIDKAPEMAAETDRRAWLVLAVGTNRQHRGNDGYDDEPESRYGWDDTVANHAELSAGDAIVVWDKNWLVGASVVEDIRVAENTKPVYRCRNCGLSGIKERRTKAPRFRCYKCQTEFENPTVIQQSVTTYTSEHAAGWVSLNGCLSGSELRGLCVSPRSQLSLRPLRWDAFRAAIGTAAPEIPLRALDARTERIVGGHRRVAVRVRRGQAGFRRRLLSEFGSVCAFMGPTPESALEACHLYSYASVGKHHDHGGFLLRRDVHRLFDLGELAVDPEAMTINVTRALLPFSAYAALHGRAVGVQTTASHRRWLRYHWKEHRAT